MDVNTDKKWYLLQAKPRQHEKAVFNLESQHLECYSPVIPTTKVVRGKKRSTVQPLFPGYIFVRLEAQCNWLAITCTRGVNKFVKFGLYPAVVPTHVIDVIEINRRRYENSSEGQATFRPGDSVQINRNGFRDVEAIYKCSVGNLRSIVLIKYLHKLHEMYVKTDLLSGTR